MESQAIFTFFLFHALIFTSTFLNFSIAADTLSSNHSLSDGETLVSPGQRFELGFFPPSSSKNRYLGIWYVKDPGIVVWVANRNNPITDSQGVLNISSNKTLVLLNGNRTIIWSSNSSRVAAAEGSNLVAKLLDSGNFVIVDKAKTDSNSYLWQSFDSLCDTLLPGMTLALDQHLTSWKAADDPSPGDFTYGIENHGLTQLAISMGGSTKRYRSGVWNGIRFSGHSRAKSPYMFKLEFNENKMISLYVPENSLISRTTLTHSGNLQFYAHNERSSTWDLMYTEPTDLCDNYGHCGPNGICRTSKTPMCECLNGFTPKSQQEWEGLNWFGGCVRSVPLECKKGEGFVMVAKVKLPDLLDEFYLNTSMSLKECEQECLKDCSCIAYGNTNISEGGSGCLMWFGDLIDTREYLQGDSEQDIYIRLPVSLMRSITESNKKKRTIKILLLSATSGLLTLVSVCGCIIKKMKTKRTLKGKMENLELPLFDLQTIAAATRDFSHENMIGEGGFGPVYKGKLSTEQEIAVKRLSKNSGQGLEEFKNEVASIAKLQHMNLVKLLGCCIQGEEKMLIYEYLCNKSLDHFLYDRNTNTTLGWQKQFDIIMGIARGLLYLHQDSRLRIIHRDLKASNILLDSDFIPKISDFGLARIVEGEHISATTKRIIGTYGYMSPEYAIDGKFSVKSDVFSLGVLLLEIVSGKRNRGFHHPDHHHSLLGHAWLLWNEDRFLELMDTCLKDSCVESQVQRCIQVGLLCVQKLPQDRPAMSDVVFMLRNEGAMLPQPKEPGFFIERNSGDKFYTNDEATITILEAR